MKTEDKKAIRRYREIEEAASGRTTPPPLKGTEHDFLGTREEWEDRVFLNANLFTVIVGRTPFDRTRFEFKDPEAAIHFAKWLQANKVMALAYAVCESGRQVMMPPKQYDRLVELWRGKD